MKLKNLVGKILILAFVLTGCRADKPFEDPMRKAATPHGNKSLLSLPEVPGIPSTLSAPRRFSLTAVFTNSPGLFVWNPVTNAAKYILYSGTNGPRTRAYQITVQTSNTTATIASATGTNYAAVVAVDAKGNASAYSTEVAWGSGVTNPVVIPKTNYVTISGVIQRNGGPGTPWTNVVTMPSITLTGVPGYVQFRTLATYAWTNK